jgi:hypothetical protein
MTLHDSQFLKAGTAMQNYTSVLTLLLRMRQGKDRPVFLRVNEKMTHIEVRLSLLSSFLSDRFDRNRRCCDRKQASR